MNKCQESYVIVIERFAVIAAPWLSVTWTAKLNVPAVVGIPEITPALRDNPPGNEPVDIDQEYGAVPPEVVKV